jgi:arginine exporter protein ArgO
LINAAKFQVLFSFLLFCIAPNINAQLLGSTTFGLGAAEVSMLWFWVLGAAAPSIHTGTSGLRFKAQEHQAHPLV